MKGKRKTKNLWSTDASILNEISRNTLRNLSIRWGNSKGRGKVAGARNYSFSVCSKPIQHLENGTSSCSLTYPAMPCYDCVLSHSEDSQNTEKESPKECEVLSTSLLRNYSPNTARPIHSQPSNTILPIDNKNSPKDKVPPIETGLKTEKGKIV